MTKDKVEINQVTDRCLESTSNDTTRYHALSYEQGVIDALEWIAGDLDDLSEDGKSWPFVDA